MRGGHAPRRLFVAFKQSQCHVSRLYPHLYGAWDQYVFVVSEIDTDPSKKHTEIKDLNSQSDDGGTGLLQCMTLNTAPTHYDTDYLTKLTPSIGSSKEPSPHSKSVPNSLLSPSISPPLFQTLKERLTEKRKHRPKAPGCFSRSEEDRVGGFVVDCE